MGMESCAPIREGCGRLNNYPSSNPDPPAVQTGCVHLSKAYEMRNVVSHGYDSINLAIVWRTIKDFLPGLTEKVAATWRALTVALAATPKRPQAG